MFAHIYIERSVHDHPKTVRILSHISKMWGADDISDQITLIDSYKDIFYPANGGPNNDRALILSAATKDSVFLGSPVCQDFDERYFYYASSAKNCLYDCEYCYLKGMYPSSHLVIDVDLSPVLDEVKKLLDEHPVYLCISYDTDLVALETLTGSVREWMEFAAGERHLRIECRTKCARTDLWGSLRPKDRFIFAFTLSPQEIITAYEHGTPSLQARIQSIRQAMTCGHPVRLCFDPMIYIKDWEKYYSKMLDLLSRDIDWSRVRDISLGSFRISSSYLRKMRRMMPDSTIVQFPFDLKNGVYQYPDYLKDKMQTVMLEKLSEYIPRDKIYL